MFDTLHLGAKCLAQGDELATDPGEELLLVALHLAKTVARLAGGLLKTLRAVQQSTLQLRQSGGLALQLAGQLRVLFPGGFDSLSHSLQVLAEQLSGLTHVSR
ncbi:hypothetical protein D3C80_1800270 [compost metagenome]